MGLEASFLVHITRAMLSLFRQDKNRSITAAQCVADQIRTLVFSSRGEELMLLMYADPYAQNCCGYSSTAPKIQYFSMSSSLLDAGTVDCLI